MQADFTLYYPANWLWKERSDFYNQRWSLRLEWCRWRVEGVSINGGNLNLVTEVRVS